MGYKVKDLLRLINENGISEETPIVFETGLDVWVEASAGVYDGSEIILCGEDNYED